MQNLSNEFYYSAIKAVFPDATGFRTPNVAGLVARVFIFETQNGPRVCRFNERPIIERNHKLTNLLYDYGAPVNPTTPHVYLGQYFESYEFDSHMTLKEKMPYMSKTEIVDTYKSAMCIQAYLSSFPVQTIGNIENLHFMDVYNTTMPHYINNNTMRYMYRTFYKHFSTGGNMCIVHSDLTPSNMLVSDDKHSIVRLIDSDAISICNENMAIFGMLRRYPLQNPDEIIEYYQDVSGHQLNRLEIIRMLELFKKTLKFRMYANNIRPLLFATKHL